jgi:hypothetical protein
VIVGYDGDRVTVSTAVSPAEDGFELEFAEVPGAGPRPSAVSSCGDVRFERAAPVREQPR